MDNVRMTKAFEAGEFLCRLGIEEKLNEFLDSEGVKAKIQSKYEEVKLNLGMAVSRLPESKREAAEQMVADALENMTEEVFIESVLGKFSEDIGYSLHNLSKYLDVTAVTQQLMEAVAEETALQNRLEEMAIELADAFRRHQKAELCGMCIADAENEEEVQVMLHAIFDGDEDAPMVIAVHADGELPEELRDLIAECIFGCDDTNAEEGCDCCEGCGCCKCSDEEDDGSGKECGCTEGACCCNDGNCAECDTEEAE